MRLGSAKTKTLGEARVNFKILIRSAIVLLLPDFLSLSDPHFYSSQEINTLLGIKLFLELCGFSDDSTIVIGII